jgi:hypothetical protein
MVEERERAFEASYGVASNSLPAEAFLTFGVLEELGAVLAVQWQLLFGSSRFRRLIRRGRARMRGRREPAVMPLIIGKRS